MDQFFIDIVPSRDPLIPSVVEPNPAKIPNPFDGHLVFKLTAPDAKFDVPNGGVMFEGSGPFELIEPPSDTEYRYRWTNSGFGSTTFAYRVFLESPFASITSDPTVQNDAPGIPPDPPARS